MVVNSPMDNAPCSAIASQGAVSLDQTGAVETGGMYRFPARYAHIILWAALLAAGAAYAWYTIFGTFREYDDEGYMMMTIRHMLDGQRLYDQVPTPYGAGYYLYKWLIHSLLRIPLNNDAIRLTTLALWWTSSAAFAWMVYRICRPWSMAAASLCFVASLVHLQALTGEPGHPQELAPVLLAIGLLAGARAGREGHRPWLLLLGLVGGALLAAKINVGVLFLAAAAVAMAMEYRGRAGHVLRILTGAGAILLPAVLMRRHLSAEWCRQFCAVAMLGVAACWIVAVRERKAAVIGRGHRSWRPSLFFPRPGTPGRGQGEGPLPSVKMIGHTPATRALSLLWCAAGVALAGVIAVGFVLARGSSPGGIWDCLVVRAMRFPEMFCFPIPHAGGGAWYATAGAALATLYAWRRGRLKLVMEHIAVPSLKVIMATAIFVQCASWYLLPSSGYTQSWYILPFTSPGWHFEYAIGFLWMTMALPPGNEASAGELVFRRMIAIVAALQILQMYPVPGSQAAVGTAAVPAIATIWLADVFQQISRAVPRLGAMQWAVRAATYAITILAISALGWLARERYRAYSQLEHVDLPGFHLTRLPEDRAALYRCLADSVRGRTFLCNTGLNSLYFWSQTRPASTVVIGDAWEFLSDAEQARLLKRATQDPRMLYIHRAWIFPPAHEPSLLEMARREFKPLGRVGPFILSVREGERNVALKSCAWAKPSDAEAQAMQMKIHGEVQDLDCRLLQLSLPPGLAEARITGMVVVDLATGRTLAKTQSAADKLALLLDRQGRRLFTEDTGRTPIALPEDPEAWRLALPADLPLERCAMPALRLYRGRTRIATLPLAVSCAGVDGKKPQ